MIYIYGGSFDPITEAHLSIIKSIQKILKADDRLVITVANTDEKAYKADVTDRFEMVRNLLNAKFTKNCPELMIQDKRTYAFLCEQFYGQEKSITLCVGEDEWKSLCDAKWVNWDLLLKRFKFLVFRRMGFEQGFNDGGVVHTMPKFDVQVEFTTFDITRPVSASKVRDILSRNPDCHYEDVNQYITHQTFRYIKEYKLYHQNGFDYDKEEAKFLQEYAVAKEKNGWGEPSVTTDTVAYNGDQILLIRRKKPPYQNFWALPGGFFEKTDEDLQYGAARELREETSLVLEPEKFVQIKTYGHNFDPRMKIVDTAFAVRVPKKMMDKAKADDDAAEHRWFNINELPKLAFHHEMIIKDWLSKKDNSDV